jgi:ubiquinone/menaquinone biosynthesis C-methylase UbiE
MLDVGAGYGRDVVRFSKEEDIDVAAVEIADGFLDRLRQLQVAGVLGPKAVVKADMRHMPTIPDQTIHCVRNNAALHHLPVTPEGLGADEAIAEAWRILVDGGVLLVLVRGGDGALLLDTREGLGPRFYQLFTPPLLAALLQRHGFSIVEEETLTESREGGDVVWVMAIAEKAGPPRP